MTDAVSLKPKTSRRQSPRAVKSARERSREVIRDHFSPDLDILFESALLVGNFAAALKAKELIGKEQGFFDSKSKKSSAKKGLDVSDLGALSDDEIEQALQALNAQDI